MIRLGIAVLVGLGAVRRVVGAEAERQGRRPVWWVVTAGLLLLGAIAGFFGAGFAAIAFDWSSDEELVDGMAFIGGVVGGALLALPAWMLLLSLRPDEEPEFANPISERRINWAAWSLVPLVPLALAVLASPLAALFFAPGPATPEQQRFIADGLPEGVSGMAVADYTLEADFAGTILVAPGVSLGCDGHTIVGTGSGAGVILGDGSTVHDCVIMGFNTAVALGGSQGATAENVTASANRIGFYAVSGTDGATIRNCRAEDNEIGYLFEESVTDALVEGNVAARNWGSAFQIGSTKGSRFVDNEVQGGGSGFWLTNAMSNEFVGNTVVGASQWFSIGIERGSAFNVFRDNEVSGGGVGIAVFGNASFNEFTGNDLHHNSKGAHTEATAGGDNVFIGNLVHDNSHVGLWDDRDDRAERYLDNECSGNGDANSVPDGLC